MSLKLFNFVSTITSTGSKDVRTSTVGTSKLDSMSIAHNKLNPVYGDCRAHDVFLYLMKSGWQESRIRGSHHIFSKA